MGRSSSPARRRSCVPTPTCAGSGSRCDRAARDRRAPWEYAVAAATRRRRARRLESNDRSLVCPEEHAMSARYEVHGPTAVITLDNPPVNGLGYATRCDIAAGVERALGDDAVKAIVITGAGRAFSGGADIK